MKIGIGIGREIAREYQPLASVVRDANEAEVQGFPSGWLININGIDALTAIAVASSVTKRIELGTAVIPILPRHPFVLAQQAMSVQAATGGRLVLGIGVSHRATMEKGFGVAYDKPALRMKEFVTVLRSLVHEGLVQFEGSFYRVAGQLGGEKVPPPPILLAALAPRMIRLAAEQSDGIITWMAGPRSLAEEIVPQLESAAAGSDIQGHRIVAGVPIALHSDVDAGRRAAAALFGGYGNLPAYRRLLDLEGVEGGADLAIVGDERSVRAQIDAYERAGVTDLWTVPFGVGPETNTVIQRTREFLSVVGRSGR